MLSREMESKPRITTRLADFIQRNRILFLVVMIVLIVFVVGYFSYTEWQRRARENSTVMAEKAQELYQSWQDATDESKKQGYEQDLVASLEQILRRYPHQYAAQRALFIRGELSYAREQYDQAAQAFTDLQGRFQKSYLAPIALVNAAVSREQEDKGEQALELYRRLVSEYKDSYLVPHALFSIGRLSEAADDIPAAVEVYNRLRDEHPLSSWTKMARNRIIELTVNGKIPK